MMLPHKVTLDSNKVGKQAQLFLNFAHNPCRARSEVLGHHFLSNAEASVFGILVMLDNLVSLLLTT